MIKSIKLPSGVAEIGMNAFSGCKKLEQIALPNTLKEIDYYTFRNCTNLTEIKIPATVKVIQANAFTGCKKLSIRAAEGTRGANFAKKNKIKFVAE